MGGAGVGNALALALVVFRPRGARFLGPGCVGELLTVDVKGDVAGEYTQWCNESILVSQSALLPNGHEVLVTPCPRLEPHHANPKPSRSIFIIQWYLERRFGDFVSRCLRC